MNLHAYALSFIVLFIHVVVTVANHPRLRRSRLSGLNHRHLCGANISHSILSNDSSGTGTTQTTSVLSNTYPPASMPTSLSATMPPPDISANCTYTPHITSDANLSTVAMPSKQPLTPNGIKAGIAGGDAYPFLKDHIGWWYDWSPNPSKPGKPIAVPMLWGAGTADATDAARLAAFKKIKNPPAYVLAYEEPDCPPGSGSSGMSVASGVFEWESLIVPLRKKGSLVISPSMCKQADENWLGKFKSRVSTEWDITAVHVNKNSLEGIRRDIDYYWNKYKKPIWVTEFACVNDKNGFVPCTNQQEINNYIHTIVKYLQSDNRVYAYAYSNGLGLGNVWPLMKGRSLSESGRTYLTAISKYH